MGIEPAYRFHRTIIERIRSGKPMSVWGGGAYCTLTCSEDFAEALAGLFLNPRACKVDNNPTGQTVQRHGNRKAKRVG